VVLVVVVDPDVVVCMGEGGVPVVGDKVGGVDGPLYDITPQNKGGEMKKCGEQAGCGRGCCY
jgi:hypothetical protein